VVTWIWPDETDIKDLRKLGAILKLLVA